MKALLAGLVALFAACAAPAAADCLTPGPQQGVQHDQIGRAIAAVFINHTGPYRFVVDTGANRSILSAQLAQSLGISASGAGEVHSVTDVRMAQLARVRSLQFGDISIENADLPILDSAVFAGEQGILGFDTMAGRRLQIDFATHCVEVIDANAAAAPTSWPHIQGQLRFGSMMMTTGRIQGVRVNILIDTGADVSLCNRAFRAALAPYGAHVVSYREDRAYTAGRPIILEDSVWTPRIHVGQTSMSNVLAYVGDYHIFELWGLEHEPSLLIGMDVIASSGAMVIDYASNTIYFRRAPRRPY